MEEPVVKSAALALALASAPLIFQGCASLTADAGEATATGNPAATACVVAPADPPRMCTMEWKPVCGCDGKTWPNACQAAAAGVTRFTPGECETKERRATPRLPAA